MSGDNETVGEIPKQSNKGDLLLQNWSKWQGEWKKVQGAISGKLHLPPGDLLMNYSEDIRQVNEEKDVLEYARIPTKFDKYRGKPDFYQLPTALTPKQHRCPCPHSCCPKFQETKECCCCSSEPTYYGVKSKKERFIIPAVDLVGIPDGIRDEKNILNGTRNIYKKWQDSVYRKQQMDKLGVKIRNIVPHWPNFEHLIIIGTKIPKEIETISISTKTKQEVGQTIRPKSNRSSQELQFEIPRLNLKLNGVALEKNDGHTKLRLFFEHDISSSEVSVDYLNFVNNGLTTMRISWKKLEKFRLFRNYTHEKFEKYGFSFCKKELVILPGHNANLTVWFKSENSGHFSENWEVITNPRIWGEHAHVIVCLESYAYDANLKKKLENIVRYIDEESKKIMIKDILNDCLEKIKYVDTPTVMCVFGEAELFEMANLYNGRPVYFFDRTLVQSLKDLYERVKPEERKWNYCIDDLTKIALEKDTSIYGQNKLTEIKDRIMRIESEKTDVKKSESKGAKGKKSKENVKAKKKDKKGSKSKSKKSKSSSKMSHHDKIIAEEKKEIKKEPYEYSNQLELWNIVRIFDSPVILNANREKYFACYEIMTAYFNQMFQQLSRLDLEHGKHNAQESLFPERKTKLVPISDQPERLIYEYFEPHYVPLHSCDDSYPFEVKRKPKVLRDVPSDDVEAIYTTYFNKPIGHKQGIEKHEGKAKKGKSKDGKKGKSKDDKKGKSKEDKKIKSSEDKKSKGKKNKSKEDKSSKGKVHKLQSKEKVVSVLSFNPYAEDYVYVSDTEPASSEVGTSKTSKEHKHKCSYQHYAIVYSCLGRAVDALVDTIESFDCVVSYPTLTEVTPQFPDNQEG